MNIIVLQKIEKFEETLNPFEILDAELIFKRLPSEEKDLILMGEWDEVKDRTLVNDIFKLKVKLEERIGKEIKSTLNVILHLYNVVYRDRIKYITKMVLNYLYNSEIRHRFGDPSTITNDMVEAILDEKLCFTDMNDYLLSEVPLNSYEFGNICDLDRLEESMLYRDRIITDITRNFDRNKYLHIEEE